MAYAPAQTPSPNDGRLIHAEHVALLKSIRTRIDSAVEAASAAAITLCQQDIQRYADLYGLSYSYVVDLAREYPQSRGKP
jgi:hypothetical protein